MKTSPASGLFEHDGWRLNQSSDDPRTVQFASAHESHHKQLQDSTSHGALARVYFELGTVTGRARFRDLAVEVTAASRNVQEAFASWLPAAALSWDRAALVAHYPAYRRYFDSLDSLVENIASPYVRFHAAHVICRCCMQTTIIESALASGLENFTLSDVRGRDLPDPRFALLRRHPPVWNEPLSRLARLAANDERLAALLSAQVLTADLFALELDTIWQRVNRLLYDVVAAGLNARGAATLALDGHLELTPKLIAQAERIGGKLDVEAGHARHRSETAGIVLGNIETETFSTAPPLPARIMPEATDPALMIADTVQPHFFVTLRRLNSLLANYRLEPQQPIPDYEVGAFARRSVIDSDGKRTVELLRLAGPDDLPSGAGVPTVTVVPMSLMRTPAAAPWTRSERLHACTLLVDVPIGQHLQLWLSRLGSTFRHVFLRIESFGRVVPFLVGVVMYPDTAESPVLVRPLSHAGVRVHKAAFAETFSGDGSLVEDGSFLDDHRAQVELSLAHLAGEEVVFGPGVWR